MSASVVKADLVRALHHDAKGPRPAVIGVYFNTYWRDVLVREVATVLATFLGPGLLQPEGHVHLSVKRRCGGEVVVGLLLLAYALI
jgi:hypothetical protein